MAEHRERVAEIVLRRRRRLTVEREFYDAASQFARDLAVQLPGLMY